MSEGTKKCLQQRIDLKKQLQPRSQGLSSSRRSERGETLGSLLSRLGGKMRDPGNEVEATPRYLSKVLYHKTNCLIQLKTSKRVSDKTLSPETEVLDGLTILD